MRIKHTGACCALSAVLGAGLLLIIYAVKGYYPFGGATVALGDMFSQVVEFLFHFYDVFAGKESFFYNGSSFFGADFYGTSANYVFSPLNMLLLAYPREMIPQAVNILYAVRVALSGLTVCLCLRRLFPDLCAAWTVMLSVAISMGGYTMCMYLIPAWLDAQILFPLLLLAAREVMRGRRMLPFAFCLALSVIVSFYVTLISLLFVFMVSALYARCFTVRETWGGASLRLCAGTALGLGISAFVSIPAALQIVRSIRTSGSFAAKAFGAPYFRLFWDKAGFFFMSALGLAVLAAALYRLRRDRTMRLLMLCLLSMMLPVFSDPVNRLWHGGTYASFPLRYGYIPVLFFALAAACALRGEGAGPLRAGRPRAAARLLFALLLPAGGFAAYRVFMLYYNRFYPETYIGTFEKFLPLFVVAAAFFLGYLLLLWGWGSDTVVAKTGIGLLLGTQILFFGLIYTGIDTAHPYHTEDAEQRQLYEANIGEGDAGYYRTKDIFGRLSSQNYGLSAGVNTVSHYSSMANGEAYKTLRRWGYSNVNVSVSDMGGTLFSDSLFCMKYAFTTKNPGWPYRAVGRAGEMTVYENPCAATLGIVMKRSGAWLNDPYVRPLSMQAAFYREVTGREDLFEIAGFTTAAEARVNAAAVRSADGLPVLLCEMDITGRKRLYLETTGLSFKGIRRIWVNGTPVLTQVENRVTRWYNPTGYEHPTSMVNGLLDLGLFENENVAVVLEQAKTNNVSQIRLGAMDTGVMAGFLEGLRPAETLTVHGNRLSAAVYATQGDMLFLTLSQCSWWRCSVNGRPAETMKVFGGLCGVPLEPGENTVEMVFVPRFFSESLILSLLSLAAALLVALFGRLRIGLPAGLEKALCTAAWRLHHYGAVAAACILYVLPQLGYVLYRVFT